MCFQLSPLIIAPIVCDIVPTIYIRLLPKDGQLILYRFIRRVCDLTDNFSCLSFRIMRAADIHPLAIEICSQLQKQGYQAYIVGGCVRDLFLQAIPKDWDIATDATPQQTMQIFPKTIPTGLQHGTITVCMGEGIENHFEVTTFRVDGEYTDGRRPGEVHFVNSIIEDLARRDLTINAIAYDPIIHQLCDPWGGLLDIERQLIRAVGNPNHRFQEDGLRIMRVARFAARFNYQIDPQTLQGMKDSLNTLKKVSKERVSDELCKTLMAPYPSHGLTILQECGALDIACPLLASRQLPLLLQQDRCKGSLETRLAFLYNKLSSIDVSRELTELKLSTKEVKKVAFLLLTIEAFHTLQQQDTALAYRQFIANIANHAPSGLDDTLVELIILAQALDLPIWELLQKYNDQEVWARAEMQINGNDLIQMGIKPGPKMKAILDACYQEILQHPEHNSKEHLTKLACALYV